MMSTKSELDSSFQQNLPQVYRATLQQFRRVTSAFVFFNFVFFSLFAAELLLFLIFLPFLLQSTLLAISLSGLFLTVFSYFVLNFYYAAKKPEQLMQLKDQFISSCRQLAKTSEDRFPDHLSIAAALIKLAAYLEDFEWQFYRIPSFLKTFQKQISSLSAFCHWQDVFRFKQILFHAAIDEHLSEIRQAPSDLEAHASLANTYITLAKIFIEPKRSPRPGAFRKKKELFSTQFQSATKLAMDEFQILNHFAPNDPWVHDQLARGYRGLCLPEEEIREVEILSQLRPQDHELMHRLGLLYFERGWNAKGLKMYEELKKADEAKAQDLIQAYGQFHHTLDAAE